MQRDVEEGGARWQVVSLPSDGFAAYFQRCFHAPGAAAEERELCAQHRRPRCTVRAALKFL